MSTQKRDTKTKILMATMKLLEVNTGKDVRMTDIAKAAGVSRQALYLHFETRADLLIETTYYLDRLYQSDARLAQSRQAKNGVDRLDAYITAWGNYIPEIYSVARAIMAMQSTDEEAKSAWGRRMQDMREGCQAAISALEADGDLHQNYTVETATDVLWTLLSVRNWESFREGCDWSQDTYIKQLRAMAQRLFVA